jgi:hypothetical protein
MNTEKLIRQLFVGKVAEIIGMEKTLELLKEATDAIEGAAKSKQADVSGNEALRVAVCSESHVRTPDMLPKHACSYRCDVCGELF